MKIRALALALLAVMLAACAGTDTASSTGTIQGTTAGNGSGATVGSSGTTGEGSTASASATGTSGSTASATTTTGTSASSSTGTTGATTTTSTTTSATGTTGGNCCASLNCPSGCDVNACACLGSGTTGTTTGGFDAGTLCSTQSCVVYAESAHKLYAVDPNPPNAITQLCTFTGAIPGDAGVNDIAVQTNGALFGITKTDVYEIDPQTCAGTHIVGLPPSAGGFNCLTFTTANTLLAADAQGQVAFINTTNGNVSDAGHFGGGYGCSGDLVALSNGTVYATAKILADAGFNDVLVTLDPAQGFAASPVSGNNLGYKGIFGLGYWGGTIYGFDKNGHTLAIDPVAGTSTLLHTNTGVVFFGAGTTPLAPIINH